MSHKIFLSYAYQDREFAESVKSKIDELLPQLKMSAGDVFDVQEDVDTDDDIRQSIKAAIEAAQTVIVISSVNADASPWVNYEAGLADALGKNLVVIGQQGGEDTALLHRFFDTAKIVKVENG